MKLNRTLTPFIPLKLRGKEGVKLIIPPGIIRIIIIKRRISITIIWRRIIWWRIIARLFIFFP
jgi:hypothetical protein